MKKNIDVIDLFDEENKKKERKLNKKMERARRKEEKLQKKLSKKLEQQENQDFDKYLEKVKEEKIIEEPVKIENTNPIDSLQINAINYTDDELVEAPVKTKFENENIFKQIDSNIDFIDNSFKEKENIIEELLDKKEDKLDDFVEKKPKKHTFLNVLVSILSVVLFVISVDYVVYNLLVNFNNTSIVINSILFVSMSILYLFSIVVKGIKAKKIFEILSLLCMIVFMGYHLFVI